MSYDEPDDQSLAEALDDSVVPTDPSTRSTAGYPADEPQGVEEHGTTPNEERVDEARAYRAAREEPDPLVGALDAAAEQQEEQAFERMISERSELSAEERAAGSDAPVEQARAILEDSELRALERELDPEESGERRTSADVTPPR
jgi:hypothetical protein